MNPFIDPEWRKQASMTATNDLDIEKAFSDQASGFVENKVGDLMKDEYRVGFEIVKKNDANTRIVGMFAFKVDKDLIFAPVFFINGEIKGPLLYRASQKTFVPANSEWASYLIEDLERRDGKSRPKTSMGESAPLVQMQRLTFNPSTGMGKRASSDVVEEPKVEFEVKKVTDATDKTPGTYVIQKSLDTKPGEQPKVSTGCSVLKMASADDGTIRISLDGEEIGMLSKSAANAIEAEDAAVIKTESTEVTLQKEAASLVKKAFFENVPDNSAQWDVMIETVEKQAAASTGLISEFLKEPNVGKPAAEAIMKAASDYKFAEALASIYPDPAKLFPEEYTEKQAAAKEEGVLEIHYATDELEKSASVNKRYFADGFYIKDTRPAETMSVVFDEVPDKVAPPTDPGMYSILTKDGKFIDDVFVAPYLKNAEIGTDDMYEDDGCIPCCCAGKYRGNYNRELPVCAAIKDGKFITSRSMYGVFTGTPSEAPNLKTTVQKHKAYMLFTPDGCIGPVVVKDANTTDGVTRAKVVVNRYGYDSDFTMWIDGKEKTLIINKDLDKSDLANGVIGKDSKFIELSVKPENYRGESQPASWDNSNRVKFEKLDNVGSQTSLNKWIFSNFGASKVKIEHDIFSEKKAGYMFGDGVKRSDPMGRVEALVKLARDMGVSATTAYSILDTVDMFGENEFYLMPTEKVASRLTLVDRPIFDDEFDSEFGVPLQPTKKYGLRVQGDQTMAPASAIGDVMNPTTTTGLPDLTVTTTAPEDLRALADTYNLPHVFEHGVIGTLADTFNAMSLVDKYVPRLEDGVDALGRTKFLIHWCPDDFEKAYGKDDMANLEAEVDNNFEDLGALLLKLLKRADKQRKPEVSFDV